jgi:hypothetical protein
MRFSPYLLQGNLQITFLAVRIDVWRLLLFVTNFRKMSKFKKFMNKLIQTIFLTAVVCSPLSAIGQIEPVSAREPLAKTSTVAVKTKVNRKKKSGTNMRKKSAPTGAAKTKPSDPTLDNPGAQQGDPSMGGSGSPSTQQGSPSMGGSSPSMGGSSPSMGGSSPSMGGSPAKLPSGNSPSQTGAPGAGIPPSKSNDPTLGNPSKKTIDPSLGAPPTSPTNPGGLTAPGTTGTPAQPGSALPGKQ